jgi:hypothetical protein
MKKSILLFVKAIIFAALFSSSSLYSQVHLPNPGERTWQDMMLDPNANFRETQQKFKNYWEGREVTRGSGYKAFKRWEWFMESRVDAQGNRLADVGIEIEGLGRP